MTLSIFYSSEVLVSMKWLDPYKTSSKQQKRLATHLGEDTIGMICHAALAPSSSSINHSLPTFPSCLTQWHACTPHTLPAILEQHPDFPKLLKHLPSVSGHTWLKPHVSMPQNATVWGALGYAEGSDKVIG
jgi:hypothetical protein